MKKIKILLFIFAYFISLPAFCLDDDFMTAAIASWQGYSIDNFMKSWGYPDNQIKIGNKDLYYWYLRNTTTTNYYQYAKNAGGASSRQEVCTVIIELDSNNNVKQGQYKGYDCPFTYTFNKKLVNPENDPWAKEKQAKKKG